MADLVITFDGGTAAAIYDDALVPALDALAGVGAATVRRASHVEPTRRGGWVADMRPSGGPFLTADGEHAELHPYDEFKPFATRADALAAERAWLARERGL